MLDCPKFSLLLDLVLFPVRLRIVFLYPSYVVHALEFDFLARQYAVWPRARGSRVS